MADEDPSCGEAGPLRKIKVRGDRSVCCKCKTAKPTAYFREQVWCDSCHEASMKLRFRYGTMRVRPPAEGGLLVAFSGGPSSNTLLALAKDYMTPTGKKPLRYTKLVVCHINETPVLPLGDFGVLPEELMATISAAVDVHKPDYFCVETLESIYEELAKSGEEDELSLAPLSLGSDLKLLEREQTTESGAKDRLVGMFKSLDDKLNSKEDLLYHFRKILLERVARREGCCVVMLGESKTRLAVRALSLTIKGRGEQLPIDVASEARVAPGISFVRPLKEIFPDEMAHFNRSLGLESALLPSVTSGLPFKASIERLTENLIVGLQNNFPATAGAVSKTAEKVTTRTTEGLIGPFPSDGFEPARGDFPKCSICLANIYPDDFMWRRLQTVETLEEIGNRESGPGKEAGVGRAIQDGPSSTDAFLHLCYSCQNIARDLAASTVPSRKADVSPPILPWDLPPHSGEAVAANRARMKLQIDEHLLEE